MNEPTTIFLARSQAGALGRASGRSPAPAWHFGLVGLVALLLAGCSTGPQEGTTRKTTRTRPMHASLDDLTRESAQYSRYGLPDRFWPVVKRSFNSIFDYHYYSPDEWNSKTLISASGMLPMPVVGVAYHYLPDASPLAAVPIMPAMPPANGTNGITFTNSWWAEAVSEFDTNTFDNAQQGIAALNALKADSEEAAQLTLRCYAEKVQARADAGTNFFNLTNLLASVDGRFSNRLHEISVSIASNRVAVLTNLLRPGIMVQRWVSAADKDLVLDAGDFGQASHGSKTLRSGFFILCGLRQLYLYPGPDYSDYCARVALSLGYKKLGDVGIATYLLQSRRVYFLQDSELSSHTQIMLDLAKIAKAVKGPSAEALAALSKLQFNYYNNTLQQISSQGAVTGETWHYTNLQYAANSPFPIQREPSLGATNSPGGRWVTVMATLTSPKGLLTQRVSKCDELHNIVEESDAR